MSRNIVEISIVFFVFVLKMDDPIGLKYVLRSFIKPLFCLHRFDHRFVHQSGLLRSAWSFLRSFNRSVICLHFYRSLRSFWPFFTFSSNSCCFIHFRSLQSVWPFSFTFLSNYFKFIHYFRLLRSVWPFSFTFSSNYLCFFNRFRLLRSVWPFSFAASVRSTASRPRPSTATLTESDSSASFQTQSSFR